MAYESDETGRPEIHVRQYPEMNAHYLVPSSTGGRTPVWSPTGNELFFINGSSMMTVPVSVSPTFRAGTATRLFDAQSVLLDGRTAGSSSVRTYDISRDGQRFLMIKNSQAQADGPSAPSIVVVQNWGEEVKATVK
jgi:serine/threonine-protein kinase